MKKFRKLIPALCMLLISAMLMGTSTYAWFSMNTTVTASGMQVQAKAEGGIVIAPYTQSSGSSASDSGSAGFNDTLNDAVLAAPAETAFKNDATMSLSAAALFPTSTSNATAWHHASSVDVNSSTAASGSYSTLTAANLKKDGKYYTGTGADEAHEYAFQGQYYLYNKMSVKATDDGTYSLWVSNITVTGATNSINLDKSMRIAIKVGTGSLAIFAPLYESSDLTTLNFYNGTAVANSNAVKGTTPKTMVANANITATATDIEIWVYYEGEDTNCKTINAVNIDTLNITIAFTSVDPN